MNRYIAVALAILASLVVIANAQAASFGRTPGSFSAVPSGAAQYVIPIRVVPGPHGVQPSISLVYNSQSGIGPLGIGWSISGLGSIYRCNKTYAQDTVPAPVALVVGDALCMNGSRLRLTGGTYGEPGSTYQTEVADFSNITAVGTAGNGPQSFTVLRRDGLTYEYGYTDGNGNGANSAVVAAPTSTVSEWLLSKVIDRAGNNYVINYTTLSGAAVPNKIMWTPTASGGSTYAYTMQFNYTTNAPQSSISKYLGGTVVSNTKLLSSISIAYEGTVSKDYFLSYQASPTTGREEVISVQECADTAKSNCFPATQIGYQNGTAGVSTTATSALTSSGTNLSARYDLNGDGIPDLVYTVGSTVYVAFGSATGYGTPINAGIPGFKTIGNLNGGPKDGFLSVSGGTFYYYTWNGSGFSGISTGLAYDSTAFQYTLADINGDGLPDLVAVYQTPDSGRTDWSITTRLNTGNGTTVSFSSTATAAWSTVGTNGGQLMTVDTQYGALRRFDFNGDGRDDLAFEYQTGVSPNYNIHLAALISNGSTFTTSLLSTTPDGNFTAPIFANVNDDACTDLVESAVLYVSACNGAAAYTQSAAGNVIAAMDWDGDGRTDLVVANGSTLGVYLSTGSGLSSLISTSVPYSDLCIYLTTDTTGDGLDDLACWNGTGSLPVTYFAHNGADTRPDLANSFTDGYGNSVVPTYYSMARTNHYQEFLDATYPYKAYTGPIYVVNQAVFSDPSTTSGTYNQQYYWSGAWMNLQGRGLTPFSSAAVVDSRGVPPYHWQVWRRDFPYTGMILQDGTSQNGNETLPLNVLSNTLSVVNLDTTANNQRYLPYVSAAGQNLYEYGGADNGLLITNSNTTYSTPDSYGNFATITNTVTDEDASSPYHGQTYVTTVATTVSPNTSTWCISLPTQVVTTKTVSGSTVPRTTQYTPDYTNCRYTQQVVEPSSSTYKVTTGVGYDAFGNVNSTTVTGVGMTARTTTVNWGTTGQFQTQVTNALSQTSYPTYDPTTGQILSSKDPNGVTTSWQYDAFARRTKETRPDGTYTTWQYRDCATSLGCLIANHAVARTFYVYNVDGSIQTDGTDWFDQADRPLMSNQMGFGAAFVSRNEVRYDSVGRLSQVAMPCTWTNSSPQTPCPYFTTNQYDVLNRVTQSQRPISASNSTLQTTTYQYLGRTKIITDPQGKTKTLISLATGSLGRTKDANGYYVSFTRDAFGSILSTTDSSSNTLNTATYQYGIGAFLTASTDMDLGNRSYTVDALGEVKAYTDAKSQNFSATYDLLSRPLQRTEPDLTTTWVWGNTAANHNIGQLQSVTSVGSDGTYSEAYAYDGYDRPTTKTVSMPVGSDGTYTFTGTYNSNTGFLDTYQFPQSGSSSLKLQYSYSAGFLQSVADYNTPANIYWIANKENPRGQITQETTSSSSATAQIVTNRGYDAVTGWTSSIQSGVSGGAALQNQSFLYDLAGNVTQRQDNNAGLTEDFYYDNDYRLYYSTLGGTKNLQMCYDNTGGSCTENVAGMGNITSRSDIASGAAWTYSTTHKHQVTQAGSASYTYTYDANGNASSRNGSTVSWTSYNYPSGLSTTTESASFDYGPNRQRWKMIYTSSAGTETTYYPSPEFEEVVLPGGVKDYRHYISANGRPVVVISRTSAGVLNVRSLLTDQQGSVAEIVNDSSGTGLVGESFTAYGNRREASSWSGAPTSGELTTMNGVTREGYTFQTVLGSMGLNHMNGRVEDAVTGRMLSADPRVSGPVDTQDFNKYAYVLNNPVSSVDPTGFVCMVDHAEIPCDPNEQTPADTQAGYTVNENADGTIQDIVGTGQRESQGSSGSSFTSVGGGATGNGDSADDTGKKRGPSEPDTKPAQENQSGPPSKQPVTVEAHAPDPVEDCIQAAQKAAGDLYSQRSTWNLLLSAAAGKALGKPVFSLGAAISATVNLETWAFAYNSALAGCLNGKGFTTFPALVP